MSKVKKILLFSDNIIENEDMVRSVGQTTMEELSTCVKCTLNLWQKSHCNLSQEILEIRGECQQRIPSQENTTGLKTTVKIFLSSNCPERLEDAIISVKEELKRSPVDSVIVIPPDVSDDLDLATLKPLWSVLEEAVKKGFISHIGIADLSTNLFKELHEWAQIKPAIIQVNLSSCCTVSEELTEFAKEHDVQILTHSDDPEVIDEDIVAAVMSRVGLAGVESEVLWLARHRSVQICYGIVLDRGYVLALKVNE